MAGIIMGVPASVLALNQEGLIERAFSDGLMPNLGFRSEAIAEEWPAGQGQEIFQTRQGLLRPRTRPLQPGADPVPQSVPYEQWVARLAQYADTIDTHMPTAIVSSINTFLANIHGLGVQAATSVNRIARNELFKAYLSGQTASTAATLAGATQIPVASLNGFQDVIVPNQNVRPNAVAAAAPLAITIGVGAAAEAANVIGFTPTDPTDLNGPGTLLLAAALVGAFAARSPVLSRYAPRVVRSGGGTSVDSIGGSDTLTIQDVINAVAILRNANVPPHEDGTYHAHIGALANAQFYSDPIFQRLNQSLPGGMAYTQGFLGQISGVSFFANNEAPNALNTGDRTATSTLARYSADIAAETTNTSGVDIGRVIITGKGSVYERYLDESAMVTEAGTTGKVGEFDVVQNGIALNTERIRLVMRSPIDRLQQIVSCSWSITTSFPMPSDITSGSGPERFKRAIVLEHAL
jgi:hypothetical protein